MCVYLHIVIPQLLLLAVWQSWGDKAKLTVAWVHLSISHCTPPPPLIHTHSGTSRLHVPHKAPDYMKDWTGSPMS